MKSRAVLSVIAVMTIAIHGAGAAAADAPVKPAPMDHSNMGGMSGMKMTKTGDVDHDFATMMRRHHEMGVRMAEEELRNGKDPAMKLAAQRIVDTHKKEIAEFDAWLGKHQAVIPGNSR